MAPEAVGCGEPDFEKELENVERTVELLERGDLPLEEAIRKYETGSRSLKTCYEILENARKRIEILRSSPRTFGAAVPAPGGAGSGPAWQPMDPIEPPQEEHGNPVGPPATD